MDMENLFKGFFRKKEKNVKEDKYVLIKEKDKKDHKHVNYYYKNKKS